MVFPALVLRRRSRTPPIVNRVVELVVVHGMGKQRSNETLLEWAEPILRRIDWIAGQRQFPLVGRDAVVDGAAPKDDLAATKTQIRFGTVIASTEGEGVVNARVDYRGAHGENNALRIRITEARWSESFLEMKRSEIFTWGLSFAPRTLGRLGSHFTRVIWYGTRNQPVLSVVPGLIGIAALWLILIAVGTVAVIFLAVVGPLLFIPLFAGLLQSIVDTLVEFVGDVAVWNRRPVRAAAMRLVVREAIDAARHRLRETVRAHPRVETELIVLAHSQGAAVTASVLFNNDLREPRPTVDTFVSVGAAVTLLGSPSWDGSTERVPRSDKTAAAPRNIVRSWAGQPLVRWINFWGIWDPFAAGPISTGGVARRQRWMLTLGMSPRGIRAGNAASTSIGPEEHALHNTAWPFTDHQSCPGNVVQVIDPVSRLVLDLPAEGQRGEGTTVLPSLLRNELHVRAVREYGTQRLLVIAIAISCIAVPGLLLFLESQLLPVSGWLARWVHILLKQDATTGILGWATGRAWFAPAILASAVLSLGLWLNSFIWHKRVDRIAWDVPGELPGRIWVGSTILRSFLVVILGAGDVGAVLLLPGIGAWSVLIAVAVVFIAACIVIAPSWGSRPVVVPANRIGTND